MNFAQGIEFCTTEDIVIEVTMNDGVTTDISGWTLEAEMMDSANNVVFTGTIGSGISIISALVFHIIITAAQNTLVGIYTYEVWRITTKRARVAFGQVTVAAKKSTI